MNQNSKRVPQREAIVDKLHGALGVLRRDRDGLYRTKELSTQRLGLIKEERQTLEKSLLHLRAKLEELNKQINSPQNQDGRKNIMTMKEEVERLGKEAKYQHSELLSNKEKLTQTQEIILTDSKVRDDSLKRARETSRKQRDKTFWIQQKQEKDLQKILNNSAEDYQKCLDLLIDDESYNYNQTDWLKPIKKRKSNDEVEQMKVHLREMQHFSVIDNFDWMSKLPKLIDDKATLIASQAEDTHRSNEGLRNILNGYLNHIGCEL